MFDNNVLVISNISDFTKEDIVKVDEFIKEIKKYKDVVIFKEDKNLFNMLRKDESSKYITTLVNSADILIYNNINCDSFGIYDSIKELDLKISHSSIYKTSIKRYAANSSNNSFDAIERKTRRESIMYNRIKFVINSIMNEFKFVVVIDNNPSDSLVKIKPKLGDGKCFYNLNLSNKLDKCTLGGVELNTSDFYMCLQSMGGC